jgi:outer membrane protein TolC
MQIARLIARRLLVVPAVAALGSLAACSVPEMARFPDYVGPAGPEKEQKAAEAETKWPTPPPETAESAGPLRLTVPDAILLALNNNRAFIVDRYNAPITRTAEQQQLAAFDPNLTGTFSLERGYDQNNTPPPAQTVLAQLGVTEFLPT